MLGRALYTLLARRFLYSPCPTLSAEVLMNDYPMHKNHVCSAPYAHSPPMDVSAAAPRITASRAPDSRPAAASARLRRVAAVV